MKTRKALSLFFCTVAFAAGAATVSVDTAKHAAGSWALSNAALGVPHGRSVSSATAYDVDGTNGFYAVALEGGGTLFLAADDEIGPILGFTASSSPDLSDESPLLNLLVRDTRARREQLAAEAEGAAQAASATPTMLRLSASAAPAATESQTTSSKRAKKLWSMFAPSSSGGPMRLGATAEPREVLASSDIRVDPIVKTKWSQTEADGKYCYNYYTPYHYPCGCVATAAGQILNRWQYPTGELEPFSNSCTVNGLTTVLDSSSPRIYNWTAMVDEPTGATSEESRQAIGALLSDLGISFGADYTEQGTGAFEFNVPGPLHTKFNYASAYTYTVNGTGKRESALHTAPVRQRAILANLDAKRPVELYILSTMVGGHAVVADGYGYVTIGGEAVEFTHINMGWAGTDDMWYNLPVVKTKEAGATAGQSGGYVFEYLMGATFNIHPTETGDLLTGRITDDDEPVEGAEITVKESGSPVVIATTYSDARGIYSFCLDGNKTYDVTAVSADGKKSGILTDVWLKPTTVYNTSTYTTYSDDDIGNSWGNDIDIVVPHVRIVGGSVYPNLDSALVAASVMDDPIVEIFGPTRLKAPITVTTNLTIRTVPDISADFPETPPALEECVVTVVGAAITEEGWALQVADGSRVAFSNFFVRAVADRRPFLNVLETGKAAFSGRIDLGTVVTCTADAFVLAGALEASGDGLSVSYAGATDRFSQFGTYECSEEVAAACAPLVFNVLVPTLVGAVGKGGTLVWDRISIDPSIAIVYATNDVIGLTRYLSVDVLFEDYANGAEVVFLKNCPADMFTNAVSVAKSTTIRSEGNSPFVVTAGKNAGFVVNGDGAELVFTNIVFTRSEASAKDFVTVTNNASFTLADGAAIADLKLAGYKIGQTKTGAVAVRVESGRATMLDGSAITNCIATSGHEGKGAAVYLKGANCMFDFVGGLITGCKAGAASGGGAVYHDGSPIVQVSGSATAYGNNGGGNNRNIYVYSPVNLILAGGLTGGEIGVYCSTGYKSGEKFATVGDGVDTALASEHFRNDYNEGFSAKASDDGTKLVWEAAPPGPKSVPEDEAEARIVVGSSTAAYATISNAFEAAALHNAEAIELLRDASISNSLSVASAIVLNGRGRMLDRAGEFCISVPNADASLTVTNIILDGGTGVGRMLDVHEGSLVLAADTKIHSVTGAVRSMVAPIVVWDGSLVMNPGVEIYSCTNSYTPEPGGPLTAGAIVLDGPKGRADFLGGTITSCAGARAGGVTIANGAEARVSGNLNIRGNTLLSGTNCNFVVHDKSRLVLAGLFTGRVGYTEGIGGSTNVFGTVDADFLASTTASNVVVSARRFRHDVTDAKGMVATNETEALLVWSSAVGDSSTFTNVVEGVTNVYDVVIVAVDDDDPEVVVCVPFAFAAIEEVSAGKWKLTLKPGTEHCTYTLKCSDDLVTWTNVGEPKELSSGDISGVDLEFFFETDASDGKKYWKVEGADGIK